MDNKKLWWEVFEECKKVPKVQEFMEQMKALGAAGGPQINCFVYHKNDIVLVANYRQYDQEFVGAIMTTSVYDDMMMDRREEMSSLPCGYFAWTYQYGYDYLSNGWNAIEAFKYAVNQGPTASMNRCGSYLHDVLYLVKEYVDNKPQGEYGVSDQFALVGIFDNIRDAESNAAIASQEPDDKPHSISIIPVCKNHRYTADKPVLGTSLYID